MTDSSAPVEPTDPSLLDELVALLLEQADEIAELDGPRAEAWASDVLALLAESDLDPVAVIGELDRIHDHAAAVVLAALRGLIDDVPAPRWGAPAPAWVSAVGTSRCEGAWLLRDGEAESVAFVFVDDLDERHVISVDLEPGPPEQVGEVMLGPGDLLDALSEDDAGIEPDEGDPSMLAARCAAALAATTRPSSSAVANGRLLVRRLGLLTSVAVAPPAGVEETLPAVPDRDPDDDAYALDVLTRSVGEGANASAFDDAVDAVATQAAPVDLAPFDPAERDAVLILEWADWLGAVIGLVRAGAGIVVDGRTLVDLVNRCPEVTTTIPKADRARLEWAFDTIVEPWAEWGLVDGDRRLTERGTTVLPAALRRAWS